MATYKSNILKILVVFFLAGVVNAQKSDFKTISFKKADSIANAYKGRPLRNMPILAHNLTHTLQTDVEKFRAIYKWVCANIVVDNNLVNRTLKKRIQYRQNSDKFESWNAAVQKQFFKRLINDKATICTGYAYLIKELSNLVGISCEIVDGYGRSVATHYEKNKVPNHSWNAVCLKGKWYLVDATWSSGFYDESSNTFVQKYNDGYFLATPELFAKNHYPLAKKWLLHTNLLTIDAFEDAPIVYSSIFNAQVIPVTPRRLETEITEKESLNFRFKITKKEILKTLELIVTSGFTTKKVKATDTVYKDGYVTLSSVFNKKGVYDVTAFANQKAIVSYTVKVQKGDALKKQQTKQESVM